MNKELLNSQEYNNLDWSDFSPGNMRHTVAMQKKYGVWRWAGIRQYKNRILSEIKNRIVIDYGGADAPLGFCSTVIDQQDYDINGNIIKYHKWGDYSKKVDVIFTSHFLEHIKYIREFLHVCYAKLSYGGKMIAHVPSIYGADRWHPENRQDHNWMFALMETPISDIKKVLYIDYVLKSCGFRIEVSSYVDDCSIFIIARRK